MSTSSTPGRTPTSKYGKRHCPVLQTTITPADCGSQRGSKLACPADCGFFPFALPGYEQWLKVDGSWTGKSLDYAARHWGIGWFKDLLKRCTVPMRDERMQTDCALYNALYLALFLEPRAGGRTLVEQWEAENWTGLTNDERVMMQHRRRGRPTVIEVLRVLDAHSVQCSDLLVPEAPPFLVVDRGVAASAPRFTRIFTWLFHYPHFSRVGPNALEVPHSIWAKWRAGIEERFDQARQARPELGFKDFLATSVIECTRSILTLSEAHRAEMFANLDLHHCVASFRYTCPRADIEAIIHSKPDFTTEPPPANPAGEDPATARYIWLRRGDSEAFDHAPQPQAGLRLDASVEGVGTLGNLRLSDDRLIFEAFTKRKYEFGRRMIERYFGSLAQFDTESVRDLASIMAEKEQRDRALGAAQRVAYGDEDDEDHSDHDHRHGHAHPHPHPDADDERSVRAADQVPPEVRHRVLAEAHQKHYRKFLDDAVPALGGLTPRAAASDPQARPALIDLMKLHIHNLERRNQEEGLGLSLDWLLEELGLRELL